ncbi:MAG: CHAT domain-containing protein [Symploca sp. SIO2E9]|nr:CHAT domain-containing protein [Symploca sp. SIO2E9]
MLQFFSKPCRWIKGKFLSKPLPPPPSPPQEISDLEYENLLLELLEEVAQGSSWGQVEGFLIAKNINKKRLALWLQEFGKRWLAQPELHQELAQRLLLLSEIATGELETVARVLAEGLLMSQPSEVQTESVSRNEQELPGVQALLDKAVEQYQAQDYQGALDTLNLAVERYSNDYRGWFNLGLVLSDLGREEEAIASYNQALKFKSDSYESWNNRGNDLSDLGRKEEAIDSYNQALKFKPDSYKIWNNRGNDLSDLGRKEEAIDSYNQALKFKPDLYQAWDNRGKGLSYLGRKEEAIDSYNQALKFKPDSYEAWNDLGLVLSDLGRKEEAIDSYDQALKFKPDYYVAWNNLGIVLSDLGRKEEAILSYDQALKIKPDFYHTWSNRGIVLSDLGRKEEAILSFDQALKFKLDSYEAWHNRGVAAGKPPGYNSFQQQQFVELFRSEISKAPQILIPILKSTNSEQILNQFQTSLNTSTELLLNTFADLDAPELIAQIKKPPSPELFQLIRKSPPPELINFIQQPLSEEVAAQLAQDLFSHPPRFNPQLNQRGYEGEIASYQAELGKAIRLETHPEGWGNLHHAIGKAHYFQGRKNTKPYSFWRKAETSYKTALTIPESSQFEELRLEILQDLIQVSIDLKEIDQAQELQRIGASLLQRMLADSKRTEGQKQKLALNSSIFDQLTVDLAIQSGDIFGALKLAETGKNTCLRWLLGIEEIPSVDYAQIQQLLNPTTAAIYWHLSPSALTTFVILPGATAPVVVNFDTLVPSSLLPEWEKGVGDEGATNQNLKPAKLKKNETALEQEGETEELVQPRQSFASLQQILSWEKWLEQWNQRYQDYGNPKSKKDYQDKKYYPWRTEMKDSLESLTEILYIPAIAKYLKTHSIDNLILIPHRDLHRFPLHYLFDNFTCTYLPSAQLGINKIEYSPVPPTSTLFKNSPQPSSTDLLIIENPKSTIEINDKTKPLDDLPFAEVEAALISKMFSQVTAIENKDASYSQIEQALKQPHQIFHFTGHGAYDSTNPAQSCLFLSGTDELTLIDIINLDLSSYHLVCLAACETAITGKETITDEYVGLVSAFLKAGATYIISTLWTVESAASALLMVEFYQQLQHQQPPAALKAAQNWLKNAKRDRLIEWLDTAITKLSDKPELRLLLEDERELISKIGSNEKRFSHPYHWAAFTISGKSTDYRNQG